MKTRLQTKKTESSFSAPSQNAPYNCKHNQPAQHETQNVALQNMGQDSGLFGKMYKREVEYP